MKLTAPKSTLLAAIGTCVGIADKKSSIPILSTALLTTTPTTLTLKATDMFLSSVCTIDVEAEPGTIAIDARELFDRVKAMPDGDVTIDIGKNKQATIKVKGAARRFTLYAQHGEDYPQLFTPPAAADPLSIQRKDLVELIQRTHFSISTDETRAHVNSLLLELDGNTIRAVSTDGHRLSKAEAIGTVDHNPVTMLLPLKGVLELKKRIEASDAESVSLVVSQPWAIFTIDGVAFGVKLVDAQFPPYQQVIPKKSDHIARVPRSALSEAIDAVKLSVSDRTGGIKLTVLSGKVRITSESPEHGNSLDEIDADYEGAEQTVGMNAKYINDVLRALDSAEVEIGLTGELDPVVVKPVGDEQFVGCLMPMRI